MRLAKAYKRMLRDHDWELRCDTNHWNLYVEGEYVYGFSMGDRVTPVRDEVKRKIRRRLKSCD